MDLGTIAKRVQDDLYADNIEAFKRVRVIIMTFLSHCSIYVLIYTYLCIFICVGYKASVAELYHF